MFDSFEEECELEDDSDTEKSSKAFTSLNEFVDTTYNSILNEPFEVFKSAGEQATKKTLNKKSLKEKLFDIYLAENSNTSTNSNFHLNQSTHLLEKLVQRDNCNTLVLNFYAPAKGYSLGFNIKQTPCNDKNNNETKSDLERLANFNSIETKMMSYDEQELLYYINAGEIPPAMIDLIDRLSVSLYNDGCIILEVRDYRRIASLVTSTLNYQYDLEYILLQPSMQTLLADLNSITNDGNFIWTQEDKYTLESQLILATAQPLCLHPSPIVSVIKHKLLNHKNKLNDRRLKKAIYKYTNTYVNRASKWNEYAMPMPFHIRKIRKKFSKTNEYMHFQTNELNGLNSTGKVLDEKLKRQLNLPDNGGSPSSFLISSLNFQSVDNWSKNTPVFKLPPSDMILVKKFAKLLPDKPNSLSPTDHSLIPIEEIILEAVDKSSKNNYSKLVIKRRPTDEVYFCQLSLCSEQTNEVVFRLGLAIEAEKYIQQYIKIFTEEGRRPVSITKNNLNSQRSNSLIRDSHFSVPIGESSTSAFTLFPLRNHLANNGATFQSYFNNSKKSPLPDSNDKQLQTYQNFFYQQQSQHKLLQEKQMMEMNKQKQHMQVQQQLHNQIKRIKSSNEDGIAKSNLIDGINAVASGSFNKREVTTRVNCSNQTMTKSTKTDQAKPEPVQITSTSATTAPKKSTSISPPAMTPVPIAPAVECQSKPKQSEPPIQTNPTKTGQNKPAPKSSAKQQQQSFVQIYVPKIVASKSAPNTITGKSTAAQVNQPVAKKTYVKKRASSASSIKANDSSQENSSSNKKKGGQATSVNNQSLNSTKPSTNTPKLLAKDGPTPLAPTPVQPKQPDIPKTTLTMPPPNTKIINASNFNLMRKIAIDSRSLPVIVTLNSTSTNNNQDNSNTNMNETKTAQLKSSQQQQNNKQIKLVNNNRLQLKPAITNNSSDQKSSAMDGNIINESKSSPIKTFQFQKSSSTGHMFKHLSFTYGSSNIHGIKPTTTTLINSSSAKASTSTGAINEIGGEVGASTTKFLVNSMQTHGISRGVTNVPLIKPTFVMKKVNENE